MYRKMFFVGHSFYFDDNFELTYHIYSFPNENLSLLDIYHQQLESIVIDIIEV